MRRHLLAVISAPAFAMAIASSGAATSAWADDEITDERTTQQRTSTAGDGGTADNIIISSSGRVVLDAPGTAVVVDSDNTLTIESGGEINMDNVNGAVGVELVGGNEGGLIHRGRILLGEDYIPTDSGTDDLRDIDGDGDEDPDGEPDGEFSEGVDKTAILVSGADVFLGNIVLEGGSLIRVFGDDSFGVRTLAPVDGDLSSAGTINMRGDDSRAISIENAVTGNVSVTGSVNVSSPGGGALHVSGDIGGGLQFGGSILSSGYRLTTRSSELLHSLLDAGDDDLAGGAAVLIEGSIANGVFFRSVSSEGDRGADLLQAGDAPAVVIQPGEGATEDITIGRVVVPAGFDVDRSTDADVTLDHGLVNDGSISAGGVFDGRDARALLIAGRDDNGALRTVLIEGGFQNAGSLRAASFDGDAIAAQFGAGAILEEIHNTGAIVADSLRGYEEDGFADDELGQGSALAILIEAGADVRRLLNDGSIAANLVLDGVSATAIRVESDALETIENTSLIQTSTGGFTEASNQNAELIAIDATAMTVGLTVRQYDTDDTDNVTPLIEGDIRFGSGDDTLALEAGEVAGAVAFGEGDDTLILRNATLNGVISDSDQRLTIDAENATLTVQTGEPLNITSARFGDGALINIEVGDIASSGAFLNASGDVTFEQGSDLGITLENMVGEGGDFALLSAGSLNIADEAGILDAPVAPYLYDATLQRDPNDANALVLTLRRRTADELGMNINEAASYNAAFTTFESVEALGAAFAALRTQEDFFAAYDQLLPEYAASAIQFAIAANDAAAGALSDRLRNARLSPDELAGIWVQEFGYFADRNDSAFGPGYRGQGVGLAMGIDQPLGPFYAVGLNIAAAASEVEQISGFDEPMVAITGQFGGYAGMEMNGFDLSGSLAVGYDSFESDRQVIIGDFNALTTADWSGWHVAAGAQIGRDMSFGQWVVRPEAALTYLALFESGFSEEARDGTPAELALVVDDRETTAFTGAASVSVARRFGSDISWWLPHMRVGYRNDFGGSAGDTIARFGPNGEDFTLRAAELPGSGLLLGLGLSAGSNYSTFTFSYDADVRDDFVRHVARLVIRLTF
ncbi:MAG: autotransporter domain-containing protein [Pseudomonadota bacterium]